MNYQFIVWSDIVSSQAFEVEALSFDTKRRVSDSVFHSEDLATEEPPIAAADFVMIEDAQQQRMWFAQAIEPQRNLSKLGLSRDNPSQMSMLHRVLSAEIEVSVFMKQVYYYRFRLIGEVNGGVLTSVRRRPRVGAVGRLATTEEIVQCMSFPEILCESSSQNNIIGRIYESSIPIAIDTKRIFYHTLVAGSTGLGKSNTIGNIIKAALAQNMACIVFDHKPDYQDIDKPNDERVLFDEGFQEMKLTPFGILDVDYFVPYNPADESKRQDERKISISASEIGTRMLAAAFFYRPGEELQRETFQMMLSNYASEHRNKKWTIDSFVQYVNQYKQNTEMMKKLNDGIEPNEMVVGAMLRKILQRKLSWMDSPKHKAISGSLMSDLDTGDAPELFCPEAFLRPGRLMVIRVPDSSAGREYGLFLSYMLKKVYDLRRNNEITFPVCAIIDEAQDVFNGSKAVRDTAEDTINAVLRKGRSKRLGFVIAVQSASQVPSSIVQNLNSRIIQGQRSEEELKHAMPGASKEMLRMALSFGPGEALVGMFGTKSIVHAQMAPSPFLLTKDEYEED